MFTAPPSPRQRCCTEILLAQDHTGFDSFNVNMKKTLSLGSHLSFGWLEVISWDNVNEEVKLVKLGDCHGNVISLIKKKGREQSEN